MLGHCKVVVDLSDVVCQDNGCRVLLSVKCTLLECCVSFAP